MQSVSGIVLLGTHSFTLMLVQRVRLRHAYACSRVMTTAVVAAMAVLALMSPILAMEPDGVAQVNRTVLRAEETANFRDLPTKLFSASEQEEEAVAVHGHGGRRSTLEKASPRRAYVTLLYSDFIHGTRALGQSLRDSGTRADTVVLVTPDVKSETRETLKNDGWM